MSEDLRFKLSKITEALSGYEEGKKLPISISDLHFIIGACNQLLSNLNKLEYSYKTDIAKAGEDTEKFRAKWKESRKISTRLDIEIMALKQIRDHAKKLPFWRKSKALRLVIESYDRGRKKFLPDEN